jgi:uncharacterized protein (TIGR02145 family)
MQNHKNKSILVILMVALFLVQCAKDDAVLPDEIKNEVLLKELERLNAVMPTSKVSAFVSGIVMDENGNVLSGVQVTIGDKVTVTDSKGKFRFADISILDKYALAKASKSGYFIGFRTFTPTANAFNFISFQLLTKGSAQNFQSETGGTLSFDGGSLTLEFPANAIVDLDGEIYSGTVQVNARYLNPESENFGDIIPGMLAGLTNENEIEGIISYGMAAVELYDLANNKLEIAGNKTARVTLPALFDAPAEVPIWHFNETHGIWVEAGIATKTLDKYSFEANYFSNWNIDIPIAQARDVIITLKSESNITYPNQKVDVYDNQNNFLKRVYSDDKGQLKLVRAPQNMLLKFPFECSDTIEKSLVINNAAETVTIDDDDFNNRRIYSLSGKITDCDNIPVSNKYFFIEGLGSNSILFQGQTDNNGDFEITGVLCDINEVADYEVIATIYIGSNTVKKDTIEIQFSGENQIQNIDVCGIASEGTDYVIDIDGNVYKTVTIGTQTWMAENLRTTRFNDGTAIPEVADFTEWTNNNSFAWCSYENDTINERIYGKLYNGYAIDSTSKICPEGWHIPTNPEWEILISFVNQNASALKSTGTLQNGDGLWDNPSIEGTNNSGFNALPSGYRGPSGAFYLVNSLSNWWSYYYYTPQSTYNFGGMSMVANSNWITIDFNNPPSMGRACRCIKE